MINIKTNIMKTGRASLPKPLLAIPKQRKTHRLSSCWRCSWSVDCVRCVCAESLPDGRCQVVVLFTWSM